MYASLIGSLSSTNSAVIMIQMRYRNNVTFLMDETRVFEYSPTISSCAVSKCRDLKTRKNCQY